MDYPEDEELAGLIARSDELSRRSRAAAMKGARQSADLLRLLANSHALCSASDKLCGRPARDPRAPEGSRRRTG